MQAEAEAETEEETGVELKADTKVDIGWLHLVGSLKL